MDAITGIIGYCMKYLLLKMIKNDQPFWFSYGTFCETMSRPQIFPIQLKLGENECHFGLPLSIQLCQCAFLNERVAGVKNVHCKS